MDEEMFEAEQHDGLPDDTCIEHIETEELYKDWEDEYEAGVASFMDEVRSFVDEQDEVYDIRFETSYDDSMVVKTAWIYYGESDG